MSTMSSQTESHHQFPTPRWRMKSRVPMLVAIGIALAALVIATLQTVSAQRTARQLAREGGDALIALNGVMQSLLDMESGQRGYLLTQDPQYLDSYSAARKRVEPQIAALRAGMSEQGETTLRENLDRLAEASDLKIAEIDQTILLARVGKRDLALDVVNGDSGKAAMDVIRRDVRLLSIRESEARRAAFDRANQLENALLPLAVLLTVLIAALVLLALRGEQHRARAAAEAEQADALREANERANLLARELNHRVKNLFALVLSIVTLSARKKAPLPLVIEDIRARIHALSLAHAETQGREGLVEAQLGGIVSSTLRPYDDGKDGRIVISGPDLALPARMVTPLGLIMHELATNAAKYGALRSEQGCVAVSWELGGEPEGERIVMLSWKESGGTPADPETTREGQTGGFGSRMIAMAANQLKGSVDYAWPPSGAVIALSFPMT